MIQSKSSSADPRLAQFLPTPCLGGRTLWIAGEWHGAADGAVFETTSPIDGSFLMDVSRAKAADIDEAVRSAASSAPSWGADGNARAAVMRQIANEIRQHALALGTIETLDSGRAIADTAGGSVAHSAGLFDYYAGLADKLHGSTVPMGSEATALVEREPFGVIAAIAPWNYPLLNAATKIAPIIACGNTLVLKPAEQTPLVTLLLARLMQQAGLPDGVVNIVTGFGAEAGAPLVTHPDVGKISFTGSSATGRHIAAEAGRSLKGVVLELGGKSPLVVFEDADLQKAARAAVFSTFMNAGQTCTSCARVLVAHDVLEQFEAHCRAEAASLRVGDPLDPETQIGPIVSVEQLERVRRLTAGVSGERVAKKEYRPIAGGHFFPPTIVSRFPADSDFAREEIFGPVMAIRGFQSDEEAWALANDTTYGLAGSVWTSSLHRAEQARRRLQCGIVWINCVHALSAGTPVSGHKTSGLGIEYGLEAADQYMKVKTTVMMSGAWNSPFATRL